MFIECIPSGHYATNCYIIGDETSKIVAVIDTGTDSARIIAEIKNKEYIVKYILITHGHFDHTDGINDLKAMTGAQVFAPKADLEIMKTPELVDGYVENGNILQIGDAEIKVITTPGHTSGGVCYLCGKFLFSGDTLFDGNIGRTDLHGGNYDTLIDSIKSGLMALDDDVVVYPGHGAKTSIGRERKNNPYIR